MLDTQLLMTWLIDDLTRLSADLTAAGPADDQEAGRLLGVDEALDIVKVWAGRAQQVLPKASAATRGA